MLLVGMTLSVTGQVMNIKTSKIDTVMKKQGHPKHNMKFVLFISKFCLTNGRQTMINYTNMNFLSQPVFD